MKSRRSILARGAFFVVGAVVSVALLAGCGGGVPGDSIADMAGNPITTKAFNHWMYVAAKGQAAQSPGSPVIIPDPPDYKNCIASIKTLAPAGSSTATLKADCKQGFTTLRDQVMDFLVRSYWYQAQAATQHIKVTDKQVQAAFATAKAAQFPTEAQFQAFLTQTGQTLQDIIYRVRVNQIYKDLLAKSGAVPGTSTDISALASDPVAGPMAKAAQNGKVTPTSPKWAAIEAGQNPLKDALTAMLTGTKSVDQAAADANKAINQALSG